MAYTLPKISARRVRQIAAAGLFVVLAVALTRFVVGYQEFKNSLTSLNDVRLGYSRSEVEYRLGSPENVLKPLDKKDAVAGEWWGWRLVMSVIGEEGDIDTMPKGKNVNDYSWWGYDLEGGSNIVVGFDGHGKVVSVECEAYANPFRCGPVAKIWNGDREEKVLMLGKPSRHSIEMGLKTIEYTDIGVGYRLEKGKVYTVKIMKPRGGEGAVLRRYVNMLVP